MPASYWRDGHGVIHILFGPSFLMACTRKFRAHNDRLGESPDVFPTCLQCISEMAMLDEIRKEAKTW